LRQMRAMFEAAGWQVIELSWGRKLQKLFAKPGGESLRPRFDAMSNLEYQRLLRLAPGALRKALVTAREGRADRMLDRLLGDIGDAALAELVADRGGHDLRVILDAFEEAGHVRDKPVVIFAHTIKGWGLPFAGDPLNHTALLTPGQIDQLRSALGAGARAEWDGCAPESEEAALVRKLPPLF